MTSIRIGEPVVHRGIVLAPLFPLRPPRARYATLEEAIPLGLRITEVDGFGSVPEVVVRNPSRENVLLYDGEEIAGAKQDRILNVTVLVAARTDVCVPVSCVERGRWSARSPAFAPARHAAYPELRRRKAERLLAAPLRHGAAQEEVWEAVAEKSIRLGVHSPTGAQADLFAARRRELAGLRAAFRLEAGQSGAVLALGDALCLDWVSRPDAFARLYPKLLDGYLLDALERLDGPAAPSGPVEEFPGRLLAAARRREPSPGLGDDLRLTAQGLVGAGLEVGGELVQVSGFTTR